MCVELLKVRAELTASPPSALIISLIMSAAGKTPEKRLFTGFYVVSWAEPAGSRSENMLDMMLSFISLFTQQENLFLQQRH